MDLKTIRKEIDGIDDSIVDLLGKRLECIRKAAKVKKNVEETYDEKRILEIIARLKKRAKERGIPGEMIEEIYKTIINESIKQEKKMFLEIKD